MKRTSMARTLRDVLEWTCVLVLVLRMACRRLYGLLRGRFRVPA
jgi:hypothetical protein